MESTEKLDQAIEMFGKSIDMLDNLDSKGLNKLNEKIKGTTLPALMAAYGKALQNGNMIEAKSLKARMIEVSKQMDNEKKIVNGF